MNKLQLALVISVICSCMGTNHDRLPTAVEFFFSEDKIDKENGNARGPMNVTWEHGVNSVEKLQQALKGKKMMLEADILMGTLNSGSNETIEIIAIMAHPPSTESDLTFEKFLEEIIKFNKGKRTSKNKKGIKLDFKKIEAVKPCLELLQKHGDSINFPVMLNADVIVGPVDSKDIPLDGPTFLNLTQHYFPKAQLSLGWTTRYGKDSFVPDGPKCQKEIKEGRYEKSHIAQMIELVEKFKGQLRITPTFPVRAGLASQSEDTLPNLVFVNTDDDMGYSLTLWSPASDPIDMDQLEKLIELISKDKIYLDLPFDITVGPENSNSTDCQVDDPHADPKEPNGAGLYSTSFQFILLFVSLILLNQYFY